LSSSDLADLASTPVTRPLQLLVVLDLDAGQPIAELEKLLPDARADQQTLLASQFGAPRLRRRGPDAEPVPWSGVAGAIERLAEEARRLGDGRALSLYVAGQGPLAAFVHLGYAISKFTGEQAFIGRRPGGPWEIYPLSGESQAPGAFFGQRAGWRDAPSVASGRVALFVDTGGRAPLTDAVRDVTALMGDSLAELVQLGTGAAVILTPADAPRVATELVRELARLPSLFPHAHGQVLCVAGPAVIAYAIGRALNPSITSDVWLTELVGENRYEPAYPLPFRGRERRPLPSADADKLARRELQDALGKYVAELKQELSLDDLGPPLTQEQHAAFIQRLKELELHEPEGDEFTLSVAQRKLSLGVGLLEALRNGAADRHRDFIRLFVLHELLHDIQGVRTTNYFEIGRAGVVLEDVDFVADLFALKSLARAEYRRGGEAAAANARVILLRLLDAALYGVEAFDLLAHGERIAALPERRLRRYLIWHLERARAQTVDNPSHAEWLLAGSLSAELAPLAGFLDERQDKVVRHALPETEFFASLDGRLVRHGARPGFEPGRLVEAVRGYNRTALENAMHFVVNENRTVLIPWRT
jgi:hypothetical protein